MLGVSACLIGVNCKYDGKNNVQEAILKHFRCKGMIPICPEQLGGLSTPRLPAEIVGGEGKDVLAGKAKVMRVDGVDVTEEFLKGAHESLKILKEMGITQVVLKGRSPSCGSGEIYDGSFSGKRKPGDGVTTALLKENGIGVCSEETFNQIQV